MAIKKAGLGRGLDVLIAGGIPHAFATDAREEHEAAAPAAPGFADVAIDKIEPSPHQPRRDFQPEHTAELADSIRQDGLLQPIVVRKSGEKYQIVAGERRWRACQSLGMKTIAARIVEAGDSAAAAMALIENLQRENLNPIEEALGYASLMRDFDLTQESVAQRVGKPRSSVANAMRLLQLGQYAQACLANGLISAGHAKVLLGLETPEQRENAAHRIVERGLSVRDTEKLVQNMKHAPAPAKRTAPDPVIKDIQKRLKSALGAEVKLRHTPKHGRIIIDYHGSEELSRIIGKLTGERVQ
jgi:ParB family chromosome partitioning protein